MQYSFTEAIALKVLSLSYSLMPGVHRVVAIYYDPQVGQLCARFMDHPREGSAIEILDMGDEMKAVIARERSTAKSFAWLHQRDLPFETEKHLEVQMTVFHEMESNVLRLAVENEHDGAMDLLYYYFPDNFSQFRLSKSGKNLMPDHRTIIGSMLYSSVVTLYRTSISDRKVLRQINGNTRSIIDRYKERQEEIRRMTSGVQRNIVDICRHLLNEISAASSVQYSLSPSAAEKLKKFKGDIPELKLILQNAVAFASALDFEGYRDEFRLDEYHIHLESARQQEKVVESTTMPSARYAKTIALLDKLEQASRSVMSRELPLTGANVGNACQKAISAPAISDALKKHRSKIITLLGLYPDRWNLIRSEFKPLINLLTVKPAVNEVERNVG
jgi:hypothetical protein